jgi:RNA polymerase sigma-70 factor (sigma-E family)
VVSVGDRVRDPGLGSRAGRESFEQFVEGSSSRLLTLAMLLTAHNRADAEDLLQTVLERAYRRWRQICRDGDPAPYVRRMLVNAAVDRGRLLRRRPQYTLAIEDTAGRLRPAQMAASDQTAAIENKDLLRRALAQLPVRQRAVLVLRYYEDLSEAQTASVLDCSVGSVKTQTSRALRKMRAIVGRQGGAVDDG